MLLNICLFPHADSKKYHTTASFSFFGLPYAGVFFRIITNTRYSSDQVDICFYHFTFIGVSGE